MFMHGNWTSHLKIHIMMSKLNIIWKTFFLFSFPINKFWYENIFLKFINDSRKQVGLNPLPRAHYYPAQPDHLQPRQLEGFQGRFWRPGYRLQIEIHRILVTIGKYMITRNRKRRRSPPSVVWSSDQLSSWPFLAVSGKPDAIGSQECNLAHI